MSHQVAKQILRKLFRPGRGPRDDGRDTQWVEKLAGCQFQDARLEKRFHRLLRKLGESIGEKIPLACQDWASTKAAYRFLANIKVGEQAILTEHFQSTRERFSASYEPMLILVFRQ